MHGDLSVYDKETAITDRLKNGLSSTTQRQGTKPQTGGNVAKEPLSESVFQQARYLQLTYRYRMHATTLYVSIIFV